MNDNTKNQDVDIEAVQKIEFEEYIHNSAPKEVLKSMYLTIRKIMYSAARDIVDHAMAEESGEANNAARMLASLLGDSFSGVGFRLEGGLFDEKVAKFNRISVMPIGLPKQRYIIQIPTDMDFLCIKVSRYDFEIPLNPYEDEDTPIESANAIIHNMITVPLLKNGEKVSVEDGLKDPEVVIKSVPAAKALFSYILSDSVVPIEVYDSVGPLAVEVVTKEILNRVNPE